jgi:hypothetical protein
MGADFLLYFAVAVIWLIAWGSGYACGDGHVSDDDLVNPKRDFRHWNLFGNGIARRDADSGID